MSDRKDKKDLEAIENASTETANSADRRKAVKNILAGSTLAAGAATTGTWVKPAVDAVMTPAHAQTSVVVVLAGNATFSAVGPRVATERSSSVLDIFMDSAHAGPAAPNFDGACVSISLNGTAGTFLLTATFFDSTPDYTLSGGIDSMGSISGSDSVISLSGSVNDVNNITLARGTVTDLGSGARFTFTLTDQAAQCTPLAPQPTTTTGSPTTAYPTTTTPFLTTTGYSTTTTSTTIMTTPIMTTPMTTPMTTSPTTMPMTTTVE